MCGIVGLFLKDLTLASRLGQLTATMLCTLSDRGPDSAGIAVYGEGADDRVKLTVRGPRGYDFAALTERMGQTFGTEIGLAVRDTHAVLSIDADQREAAVAWLGQTSPAVDIIGQGRRLELYKEVGAPEDVARRFGLSEMIGTHAIGHTRMATESAVTTLGAHPFSTGLDQCLVHNGSLSNHNGVRRDLLREGLAFATENDTEVAAGYLTWRMRQGMSLDAALHASLSDLDGFYTFVVGTETGFGVLRDPIACKPAVMAETDRYVAFGSEFRALAELPDIDDARLWEPEPATVYFWERQ